MHIWVLSFMHRDTQKKKKDSQWALTWSIVETLLCIFLFKLLVRVRAHKLYNNKLKLRKNSARVSKTYFLLKAFSARFHPSRKSIFAKFLQKYGSGILSVLNTDENSLQIQTAINILDQFYSSLCTKKICRGLNTFLHSNMHSSEPYLEPSWRSATEVFCKNC